MVGCSRRRRDRRLWPPHRGRPGPADRRSGSAARARSRAAAAQSRRAAFRATPCRRPADGSVVRVRQQDRGASPWQPCRSPGDNADRSAAPCAPAPRAADQQPQRCLELGARADAQSAAAGRRRILHASPVSSSRHAASRRGATRAAVAAGAAVRRAAILRRSRRSSASAEAAHRMPTPGHLAVDRESAPAYRQRLRGSVQLQAPCAAVRAKRRSSRPSRPIEDHLRLGSVSCASSISTASLRPRSQARQPPPGLLDHRRGKRPGASRRRPRPGPVAAVQSVRSACCRNQGSTSSCHDRGAKADRKRDALAERDSVVSHARRQVQHVAGSRTHSALGRSRRGSPAAGRRPARDRVGG